MTIWPTLSLMLGLLPVFDLFVCLFASACLVPPFFADTPDESVFLFETVDGQPRSALMRAGFDGRGENGKGC